MNEQRLADLAEALRSGEMPLARHLDELEARFTARESSWFAFLPEPDRFGRLRREAEHLLIWAAELEPALGVG